MGASVVQDSRCGKACLEGVPGRSLEVAFLDMAVERRVADASLAEAVGAAALPRELLAEVE